jgi:hypothetical protein
LCYAVRVNVPMLRWLSATCIDSNIICIASSV